MQNPTLQAFGAGIGLREMISKDQDGLYSNLADAQSKLVDSIKELLARGKYNAARSVIDAIEKIEPVRISIGNSYDEK